MQKWEYNAKFFIQPEPRYSFDEITRDRLEKLGDKGWELVSIQPMSNVEMPKFPAGREVVDGFWATLSVQKAKPWNL